MADVRGVGPYFLKHVLGKGQTGTVRFAVHSQSHKEVAIKIVNKSKIQPNILAKVEREITVMKLIEHHNILQLYDVYESKKNLFLVLEYVDGGELFEYLVKKGRLHILEAKQFFKQLVSAIHYCHEHLVCHRDLKPENLLLDSKKNIKIADFGMASVQVENGMLETSCGSPHYACPEVVKGVPYDGRKADSWSCGVILYALVVGCLPFDDDNLRVLLEKVKRGVFTIPAFVPSDCVDLIHKMITVNPDQRYSLYDVKRHPFCTRNVEDIPPELPLCPVVTIKELHCEDDLDADVVSSMTCLGCFKDKERLMQKLFKTEKNTEKIIYFLLLDRKSRRPATQDDAKALIFSAVPDAVRKRIDSPNINQGRRSLHIHDPAYQVMHRRPRAATTLPDQLTKLKAERPTSLVSPPGSPWRDRLLTKLKHKNHDSSLSGNESFPSPVLESVKRSWFLGSLFHVDHGSSMKPIVIEIKDRTFAELKADLIHSMLVMPKVSYVPVANKSFKLEYKKKKGRFSRGHQGHEKTCVEIHITEQEIQHTDEQVEGENEFNVAITFESGSHRKFRKLCEKLHSGLHHRGLHRNNTNDGSVNSMDKFLLPSDTPADDGEEVVKKDLDEKQADGRTTIL